jgi:hypothetical protein
MIRMIARIRITMREIMRMMRMRMIIRVMDRRGRRKRIEEIRLKGLKVRLSKVDILHLIYII